MTTETASLIVKVQTQGIDKAASDIKRIDGAAASAEKSTGRMSGAFNSLRNAIAAAGIAKLGMEVIQTADAYQNLQARLTLATGSAENAAIAYQKLLDITRLSHAGIEETANLYAKLSTSTKSLGLDQSQLLAITDTVGKGLRISGAGAQESESALRQLGQAFASGTLRGDEFNSMMENAPRLAQALADSLGVTRGELRQMAADGQLTSQALASAFLNQSKTISAEFDKLPQTVGTVMADIRNELFNTFGSTETSPLVDSLKEFRELLKDPEVKQGLADLAAGMVTLAGGAVKLAAGFGEFWGYYKQATASEGLEKTKKDIELLDKGITDLQAKQKDGGAWGLFAGGKTGMGIQVHLDDKELADQIQRMQEWKAQLEAVITHSGTVKADAGGSTAPATDMKVVTADQLASAAARKKQADELQNFIDKLKDQGATASMTAREVDLYKAAQLGASEADKSAVNAMHDLIAAAELHKKQLEDRKAVDDYLKNLKEQDETLGMNVISLERYRLAQLGATDADLAAAEILQKKQVAFQLERDLMTEQERALQDYAEKRALIMESTSGSQQTDLLGRLGGSMQKGMSDFGQESGSPSITDKMAELQAEYDARYATVMENEALIETDKQALLESMQQGYLTRMAQFEEQKQQQQFASASAMFDGLAGLAKTFGGEQSKAYKVLFATSKAFSIAQATMSMFTGISKGVELGFPAMIPAIAAAAAQGASAISGVKSQNFAGAFDNGGNIPAGSVGLVGEIGPELISGPANVTSRKDTAAMLGEKQAVKVAVFNLWNAAMIESLKTSDEFDEVIINSISRNQQATKQAMG